MRKLDMLLLPGIVVWLPALKLNQTEETAGDIRLVLTGTVDKTSLGHLHTDTHTQTTATSHMFRYLQLHAAGCKAGALNEAI